jgi:CRISPR type IV-associated protein Csf2
MEKHNVIFTGKAKAVTKLYQHPQGDSTNARGENFLRLPRIKVIGENGTVLRVPRISGNSFRGILRRMTAHVIFDKFLAQGKKIDLKSVHWMVSGASRNATNKLPDEITPPVILKEVMEEGNIHSGLFGGGLGLPGSIAVHDLVPKVSELAALGLMYCQNEQPEELPALSDVTGVYEWVRKDLNIHQQDTLGYVAHEDLEAYAADLVKNRKDRKKAKKEKEKYDGDANVQQLGKVEYLAENLDLFASFEMMHVTPAQVGLMIAGLERFANDPFIGAMRRWGWGKIDLNLKDQHGRSVVVALGQFEQTGFDAELDAFEEWLDTIETDRLDPLEWLTKNFGK